MYLSYSQYCEGLIPYFKKLALYKKNKSKLFCIAIQYITSVATNIDKSIKGHIGWLLSILEFRKGFQETVKIMLIMLSLNIYRRTVY